MLKTIYIKDFALIDELTIDFDNGLNIITGETGAGKSIIIDAIDLTLGARGIKEQIKTGSEKAFIELQVKISNTFPVEILEENGIEVGDDKLLIISREILPKATRSRINGALVTQNYVQDIRKYLIDIHSQNQAYTYIQPKTHIDLVDNYGDAGHIGLLENFKDIYQAFIKKQGEYNELKDQIDSIEQKIDFLKFQIKEIDDAKIENIAEDVELEEQRELLVNAGELKELTYSGYQGLYGQDGSIIDSLSLIEKNLQKAVSFDKNLAETILPLAESIHTLKDSSNELRKYSENLEIDEESLLQVEERILLLDKIKRKHGSTLEEVMNNFEKFSLELESIEFSSEKLEQIKAELSSLEEEIESKSKLLSASRKIIAETLSALVENELVELEMPKIQFQISFDKKELNPKGIDDIEFLISTNAGEVPKPLSKIASGGEISRVMLAVKTIFAKADGIDTVIFDEIDSGISGKASQSVASKLAKLSKTHQTICITHQPIIAAMADRYFYVEKNQTEYKTSISVKILEHEDKKIELAKLASGSQSKESLDFAKQLLDEARIIKAG